MEGRASLEGGKQAGSLAKLAIKRHEAIASTKRLQFDRTALHVIATFSYQCCLQHGPAPQETQKAIEQQLKEEFALMDEAAITPADAPVADEINPDIQDRSSAPTRRKSTGRATKKVGGKNLPVATLRRNIQAWLQEEPGLEQFVAEVLSA